MGDGRRRDGHSADRDPDGSAINGTSARDPGEEGVAPSFDAKLQAGGVTFGSDDATLLRIIDEAGSLNATAEALGRSYSRAHKRLRALEEAFGPLVESRRGGVDGGGSELTDGARRLLAQYERLRTEFSGVTGVAETVFDGEVVERDGKLAVVETAAGCLWALTPTDLTNVIVTVRSDTITLHDVDAAPNPSQTSARNRFRGTVIELAESDSLVSVTLDVGSPRLLIALVTATSKQELDLQLGSEVVASFKTTATRASPRE